MLSAILMASCQTTGSNAKIDTARVACGAFAPIYWSAEDTAKTITLIKEHNAAWRALCRA